jgi:hypothetical protein
MARLIVTAFSEDTRAAPGNRAPCWVVVSVTDADGAPIGGLMRSNFEVDPIIVGAGGAEVDIIQMIRWKMPGFYAIKVVPIGTATWKKGVYIFAVVVKNAADKGQTLAKVLMD